MIRRQNALTGITCIFILFLFIPVMAMSQLQADFVATPLSGCPPMVINFKDTSTGNPEAWRWDFGDGRSSHIQNPAETFNNPGIYTIKLVVKNALGIDSLTKSQYITVNALPVPAFTASQTTGCFPLKVAFTDQSLAGSGTITAREWDFGDGAVSSEQNPVHTYTLGGNFRVILKVANSNGCVEVKPKSSYIRLKNGVKADFDYFSAAGCSTPAAVSFNNKSTGAGQLSYKWDFGDSNTSKDINPVNNYQNGGVYSVKLIVNNNYGCTDTLIKPNAINIGFVKADYTKPDVVCAGTAFQLTNTSNPSSFTAVTWNFGDSTASAAANPLKLFALPGTYPVKMLTDFGTCKDSITKEVTVLSKPVSDFAAINTNSCAPPLNVGFNNTANGAVSYLWNFGDSATSTLQNPGHAYLTSGSYSVALISANAAGCRDTIVKQNFIKIIPPKIASIRNLPAKGCIPLTITPVAVMRDSLQPDTYLWDFGDGAASADSAPSHTYTIPGNYNVKVIITVSGCTDSLVIANAVKAGTKPMTAFKANPRDICASDTVTFTDLTTGVPGTEWLWSFGDGTYAAVQNPVHKYRDTGYFKVTLVVRNYGCGDTLPKKKYIHVNPPAAKFDTAFLCSNPLIRKFIDKSAGAMSWAWNFGDGSKSNVNKPVHTYAGPGSYLVSLTATNGACTDSVKKNVIIIKERGKLQAGNSVSCINAGINFTVTDIIPANIRSYAWYFNGIAQPVAPVYTNPVTAQYATAGPRKAAAVITDILNCRDTLYTAAPISVYGSKAAFNSLVPGGCPGSTITFNDSTKTDGIHAVTNWSWNFGDGSSQSYINAPFTHTYNTEGVFGIGLSVTDSYGCKDSIYKPAFIVIAKPRAKFTRSDTLICPNTTITFYNQTNGSNNTYLWQFGDSATSADINPLHTYLNEGRYKVMLKVVNKYGCRDSLISYINVIKTAADFLMSDSFINCPPITIHFTNTSKGFSGLLWDFDDQAVSDLINPSHIFTAPGIYTVKLLAQNNTGCSDSVSKKIVVKGPKGDFNYTPLTICAPGKVDFNTNIRTAVKFYWNYQEGNTDSTIHPFSSHIYATAGSYLPQILVEDSAGCRFAITGKDTIIVNNIKTKIISDKNVLCDSGTIHFTDSTVSSGGRLKRKWSFDDGATSSLKSPVHSFTRSGNYHVKLIVTTESGCTDSASVMITVAKSPAAAIISADSACASQPVIFLAQSASNPSAVKTWNWNFGNGKTSSLQLPSAQNYKTAGNYTVSLSVTNTSGCVSSVTRPIVIKPLPTLTVTPDAVICAGNTIPLSVSGASSYTWLVADSSLSCTNCVNPVAAPLNNITYQVKGTSAAGCSSVDSIIVKVLKPFNVTVSGDTAVCNGKSVQLTAQGAPDYKWLPSTGLSSASVSNPVAKPFSTTAYRVVGYDANETLTCVNDTASVTVMVYANPSVDLGPDKTIATRSTVALTPAISNDVINLRWSPATGLSCTDCPKPEFIARNSTFYKLRVENEHCFAEDEIKIIVTYDNRGVVIPNAFSPNGDGINDVFYPTGNNASFVKSLTIYNRWGNQMFSVLNVPGNDPAYGWNGTWKGAAAQVGVYYYIAQLVGADNKTKQYTGNVTLLK